MRQPDIPHKKIIKEIRKVTTVQPITTHLMQKRLPWHGHVRRRDDSHLPRTFLDMELEGEIPSGRPTLRRMDTTARDTKKNGLTDVNILDRKEWKITVSRVTHWCGRDFNVRR